MTDQAALVLAHLPTALALSSAIGAVAYTTTSTEISAPLRSRVVKRSLWVGKLLACPYCLSHWLAFAAVAVYRPYLVDARASWGPLVVFDFLVTAFALIPVAMVWVWLVKLALGKAGSGSSSHGAPPASAGRSASRPPGAAERFDKTIGTRLK